MTNVTSEYTARRSKPEGASAGPAVPADEGYEDTAFTRTALEAAARPGKDREVLQPWRPNGNHQSPPHDKLRLQSPRNRRRSGGDEDSIVRRRSRPSFRAVGDNDGDVGYRQVVEHRARAIGEPRVPFDGNHVVGKPRKNRRLIPRSRPDLEHVIAGLNAKCLRHHRDHVRLRDGLPFANGQGTIVIRVVRAVGGHKQVPRHGTHRLEDTRIVHTAACNLRPDHAVTSFGDIHPKDRISATFVCGYNSGHA